MNKIDRKFIETLFSGYNRIISTEGNKYDFIVRVKEIYIRICGEISPDEILSEDEVREIYKVCYPLVYNAVVHYLDNTDFVPNDLSYCYMEYLGRVDFTGLKIWESLDYKDLKSKDIKEHLEDIKEFLASKCSPKIDIERAAVFVLLNLLKEQLVEADIVIPPYIKGKK